MLATLNNTWSRAAQCNSYAALRALPLRATLPAPVQGVILYFGTLRIPRLTL